MNIKPSFKHIQKTLVTALLMTGIATSAASSTAELNITVTPIVKKKGEVMLAIYNSKDTFSEKAFTAQRIPASSGEAEFTFKNLPVGEYAVMVIHDVNGNGELDTNLFKMPTEPWGGSLQGKRLFGAPQWKDTRFELPESGLSLTIDLN